MVSGFLSCFELKSALAELRCTTCSLETVLLSFLHTWVTCEEASLLECWTEFCVELEESTCDTETDSTCLACEAATENCYVDVELAEKICFSKWLTNDELECFKTEVVVDVTVVDCDLTCSFWEEVNLSY